MSEQPTTTNPTQGEAGEGSQPLSKKAQNKLKKEQEKAAKKAQMKQESDKQPAEQQEALNPEHFGELPLIQSQQRTGKVFEKIGNLNKSKADQVVTLRARLHNSRGKGNLVFLLLRQSTESIQAVLSKNERVNKPALKFASSLSKETLLEVEGIIRVTPSPVEATTQTDVEIEVTKLFVASKVLLPLPLQLEDAGRPLPIVEAQQKEIAEIEKKIAALDVNASEEDKQRLIQQKAEAAKFPIVGQDVRLDYRILDLRVPAHQGIFRIQSAVGKLFRDHLTSQGFVEIHTPKIISGASEGGAQVFKVKYFETDAFLAQSPQLYKQMAICSDIERVFEIGPVFRAENSFTHRHLTEFVGLDLEMAFNEHYHEVLDVLDNLFVSIFEGLAKNYNSELQLVNQQYPFEPFQFLKPSLRLEFPQAIAMLREAGENIGDFDDVNTAQEKLLGRLVKEKYHTDFYILDKFPKAVRPFYTMPSPQDDRYTNSYDFFVRGEEIVSGSQRIHDPVFLERRARECGIEVRTIQSYIDAFKFGAPPHGGCGVGLERLVMLY
eukprot:TRINITY_DN5220_c0_g1_i1.p1 TRINITY_DN5220_c0_g1~~TRINITY_DN5220_c0_g1_i1.p1  ORF type:complete len:601 (-),score=142.43 TRINITY_DN5220_c0_g1_i1:28-1674(-)